MFFSVLSISLCVLVFSFFKFFNYYNKDLYLEKIKGSQALAWVKNQNTRSLKALSDPRFKKLKSFILNVMESEYKIIYGSLKGKDTIYHLLKNKEYKRGLLRRTSFESYLSGKYQWEEVLNIDALAEKEKENWVYERPIFHPEGERVLFSFSRGGKDASVMREFDLVKKKFIKDSFDLPESRSYVSWISKDEIMLATDWKTKDSFTDSNYPRILKTVKRGTALSEAITVLEAEKTDMLVYSLLLPSKTKGHRLILFKSKDFFSAEFFLRKDNGEIIKIPLPLHADIQTSFQGDIILTIEQNWTWKDRDYKAGSFLIVNPDKLIERELSAVQILLEPTSKKTLLSAASSKNRIYIKILEDIKSSIVELKPDFDTWKEKRIPLPSFSNISIIDADPRYSDVFFSSETFLETKKLYHYNDVTGQITKIQELPSRFDPSLYKVEQFFAESFDKTAIPYFVVSKKDIKWNGKNPTLLYAYGGFQLSELPFYSSTKEFAWYRKGGVFVMANIRGGGEYGPLWHQAGLKKNRQKVFNDFYAVAEDLIRKKITSPSFLGIQGESNGGLLMGVAITQKPELFQAALIGNPLLDMLRYHKLLVGSSWIPEYGDPEVPEMKKFISSYSPYQNLSSNSNYPEVFLFTSTLDDRVHPGHARRFARKLEKMGKPFYYYENFEGGHSSASNYEQIASLKALQYIYLYKKLMKK